MHRYKRPIATVFVSLLLAACGGSGDIDEAPAPATDSSPYQGTWTASFTGDDVGSCSTILVSAAGAITGSCVSRDAGSLGVTGTVSSSGAAQFTAGDASTGATFDGDLTTTGTGVGSWVNTHTDPVIRGTWTANKQN
jgi:hypothetical protein